MQKFADLDLWLEKAKNILSGNRIEVDGGDGNRFRYTAPSLDTGDFGRKDYAQQFMWDSCFHAVMWRWFDPQMAQDELLALSSRQVKDGPDAGMIPHCNYWRGGGEWLWKHDERSSITQPPLIASAAVLVYERSENEDFLRVIYERNRAYHDWFDRRRDPDGDKLVCLIHPWEAGGDALPRWDKAMGIDTATFTHEGGRRARHDLAHKIVEYDTDAAALARDGYFCVESMDFNAIRAADIEAMAEIATILGKTDEAQNWRARVDAIREAFQAKMIVDGLPYDLSGVNEEPIIQASAGQFMTLFGGLPTPEQAGKLVEQLQQPNFWTAFPVPTSPIDSPAYAPDLYWRGNVWPSVNWLIFRGLLRYGYNELAADLAARSLALIDQSQFWEYYHPETGQGLGGQTFSWTTVMLDMAATMAERA